MPVEHEEILEEISLKEVVMPSPLGEESPYAYPAVEGAVYVDFTDPIQKSAFEELVKKYGIDSIDQPFTNLDLDYYRIHFDPAVDHGNFIAALQDTFGDNLRFAEPIPLIQVTFPLFDAGTLTKQTMPDYLTQI